ncbi:MAG: radical SAM protein [Candidatus Moraniibacteriota bacterium]
MSIVKNSKAGLIDLSNYGKIPNVTYSQDGVIATPVAGRVDLKMYPDRTISDASQLYDSECKVYAYETSRGCAWGACTFCSIKHQFGGLFSKKEEVWGWRCHHVERVLTDLKSFAAQGARVFDLKDSEFFGPVRRKSGIDPFDQTAGRIEAFARGLIEINKGLVEKISINHVSARVDTIYRTGEVEKNQRKRRLYELLKEAGLKGVYLGVESGSHGQMKRYCKGSTIEENKVAIQTMRDIGLDLEVGFIFFDSLVTIEELLDNIKFIEETELYKTPSRLFGSLRIQTCTPYHRIAERNGLIGEYDSGMMTSRCLFQNEGVQKIEDAFNLWEEPTRKLIKLLPREAGILLYRGDFCFMKDLVIAASLGQVDAREVFERHVPSRHDLLSAFANEFRGGDILEEYLADSIRSNEQLLVKTG